MLCRNKPQQQAKCPWITSPCTLWSPPISISALLFSWMSVSPLSHSSKSFHRKHYACIGFCSSAVSSRFLHFSLQCFGVFVCIAYLPAVLVTCKGKWGWPRLDSNNYLGHVCVFVCVPYATIAAPASWDSTYAVLCTHVHKDTQMSKLVCTSLKMHSSTVYKVGHLCD